MERAFTQPNENNRYRLFPDKYENAEHILFHGTSEECVAPILRQGFRPSGDLQSTSFVRTSGVSLGYACDKRTRQHRGVVIVVQFQDLNAPGIRQEGDVIYLDDPNQQPEILAYCYIPHEYRHI